METSMRASVRRAKPKVVGWVRAAARPVLDATPAVVLQHTLHVVRKLRGFQISATAMRVVAEECKDGTSLLVFGVGRDSSTWESINRRGRTAFLEDVPEWLEVSLADAPGREAFPVTYSTRVRTSHYRDRNDIPIPEVPEVIAAKKWDIVVVDGPQGFDPDSPGRASSIALAATLVRPGGLVLIDDFDRPLEAHIAAVVFGRAPDRVLDARRPVGLFVSA